MSSVCAWGVPSRPDPWPPSHGSGSPQPRPAMRGLAWEALRGALAAVILVRTASGGSSCRDSSSGVSSARTHAGGCASSLGPRTSSHSPFHPCSEDGRGPLILRGMPSLGLPFSTVLRPVPCHRGGPRGLHYLGCEQPGGAEPRGFGAPGDFHPQLLAGGPPSLVLAVSGSCDMIPSTMPAVLGATPFHSC